MDERAFPPHSPFESLAAVVTGPGILASGRDGLGIATVMAHKGRSASLAKRVKDSFEIELPYGPHRNVEGGVAFAGTGPDAWLVVAENGGNAFAATLRHALHEDAAIADQSDGYAVLRITGPKVLATLAKGVPLDLHAQAFRVGDVAVTIVAHIGVTLWRLDDSDEGETVFEFVVFRSLAHSFWHWLSESSAEFGLTIAKAACDLASTTITSGDRAEVASPDPRPLTAPR